LSRNKKLLAEVMADAPAVGMEGSYEVVLGAMELAPTLGLTFEGDEKSLLKGTRSCWLRSWRML
jgi:hypothetical protein